MKKLLLLTYLSLSITTFSAFADQPIKDLIDVAVPVNVDGTQFTLEEVQRAILTGCKARGWTPVLNGQNAIKASILVRSKHFAEISIPFSSNSYSIKYIRSEGLDYDPDELTIHRNYNKWVVMLSGSIQRQFGVRSQGY
ncbi:hypothetical protein KDN34_11050 [Shewanella yunxiaonensis]|uniref:Lipoprotein n=1 Tax=Shewanella yunxiaonensis TaxID=2829809 RepID=A0ABX7YR58_9GAMM|nr:hypothetical protein [Shewanella yunxiaonensis]QUN04786.1 hypothetical protein KDN34_11050 [Shewanella yunxiaonensis]